MVWNVQAYPEYKEASLGWLTEIPSHWEIKKLKYLGEALIGLTYSPDDVVAEGEGTLVLRSSNIQNKKLTFEDNVFVNKLIPQKLLTLEGDILICSRNGSRSLIGKNAQLDSSAVGLSFGAFMSVFRSTYNNYLSKVFNSPLFEYQSGSFLTATINQLTTGNLSSFEIPLPPERERKIIAAFLDHKTAKIDTLIEKQQQLIALLKEKRQAVISHAVTKGLNPNAPMRDSGVEWLGEVPAHWTVAGFKKYLNKIVDYRGKTPEKYDTGVFLVTARNLKGGRIDYEASQEYVSNDDYENIMSRGKPKIGEVLFTTEAPLGEVALVDREDIALAQRIIKFDGQAGILNNRFLKYFIMSNSFQASLIMHASGSTALGIKTERLVYLRALIPPEAEQLEIVSHIEAVLEKVDTLITKAMSAIELMQERRSALISAAVTGKIDVRGWQEPEPFAEVEQLVSA